MRIEQRIGRVDRIGQDHPVAAYNFVLENSVDRRVMEVLEEKLRRILQELGTDKWGDVLEGASTGVEDLYTEAILNPENFEEQASTHRLKYSHNLGDQHLPLVRPLERLRHRPIVIVDEPHHLLFQLCHRPE